MFKWRKKATEQVINFNDGSYVSYHTRSYYQTNLTVLNVSRIKAPIKRLYFSRCFDDAIYKAVHGFFRYGLANLNQLVSVRAQICFLNNQIVHKLMKVLSFCESLDTFYIRNPSKLSEKLLTNLCNLMIEKANENKFLNIGIFYFYRNNVEKFSFKLGYLLQKIACRCKKYFEIETDPETNKLFFKYFLLAGDLLARKFKSDETKIYVGRYVKAPDDEVYLTYQHVLNAGKIKLHSFVSGKVKHKLSDSDWDKP